MPLEEHPSFPGYFSLKAKEKSQSKMMNVIVKIIIWKFRGSISSRPQVLEQ